MIAKYKSCWSHKKPSEMFPKVFLYILSYKLRAHFIFHGVVALAGSKAGSLGDLADGSGGVCNAVLFCVAKAQGVHIVEEAAEFSLEDAGYVGAVESVAGGRSG